MRNLLFIPLFFIVLTISAQEKKPLTFDEILKWNRITETRISNDGNFIVYEQEPWKGDPALIITTPKGNEIANLNYGSSPQITADSKFLIYNLNPPVDTVRKLKLEKTKKDDLPKNKLVIRNLKSGEEEIIEAIQSSKVPDKWSGWIAWQAEIKKGEGKDEGKKEDKNEALPLKVKNLMNGESFEFSNVSSYVFAEEKEVLAFVSESNDSTFKAGVYVWNLKEEKPELIFGSDDKIKKLSLNKTGEKVAFLVEEKKEVNSLYVWQGSGTVELIADNKAAALPENYEISENASLSFSDSGNRLFFGTAPKKPEKDSTVLDEEIPALDVWVWNEETLHTVQLKNKIRDAKKSYLAVAHLNSKKVVQLETEQFTGIRKIKTGDADLLLAWSNRPYAVQAMWEGSPRHNDFYLVDIKNGLAVKIKENCRATPSVSPDGKYLFWSNSIDTTWNTINLKTGKEFKITTPSKIQVADELNDIPNPPRAYGIAGWLKNDEALLVYDRYDIWKVDPENNYEPINLTKNGRKQNLSYRLVRFNPEPGEGIDASKDLFLKAHDEITRVDSYYKLNIEKGKTPERIYIENHRLGTPQKAKDADVLVFTKEDFHTYPNLIATDFSFKKQQQISDAAPQQTNYLWGTAELVSWNSLDGRQLEGMLFKPENFDPSKKYPMIVNFYEKSSQGLLSYRMPENHRSTIDYHYYTSNGYVVFNPDVYYREGYPGESAFNCVMPGVETVVSMGFIDEKRIGAQGHSWGGYQVAYLATRTNRFAAIESGAPVVNMFSAYGGIRWGSGLNRSFQYEHTQSRIGKSIWESPLRYLENSPLFTLDKIETPLLIMHNDDDGAVPWYQGIEFFIGMRRLQKPCWLLNYNEADHWPLKVRDKHDFQIRLAQFFNHYLKDEPMPVWMKSGIPATKKGIELGYELAE